MSGIVNKSKLWTNFIYSTLFVTLCLIWGTTWLAIKISIESIPPLVAVGLRFLIACPIFLSYAWVRRESIWFPKQLFPYFLLITAFYFALPYWLTSFGQQYISSGLAGLLYSSMPVFILLFSSVILRERFFLSQIIGMIIGFLSLAMIVKLQYGHLHYFGLIGVFAVIVAAVIHALAYVILKKVRDKISTWAIHTLPLFVSGLLSITVGFALEQPDIAEFSKRSILAATYLALFGSCLGSIVYVFLLQRMNTIVFSFIFIIFPVIAVAISAWYENMPISEGFLFYTAILLTGFAITKFPIEKWKSWKKQKT